MIRWKKRIRKMSYVLTDMLSLLLAFIFAEMIFEGPLESSLALTSFERLSFIMLFIFFHIMMYLILSVYEDTIENYGSINFKIAVKMIISLSITEVFIGAMLFYMKVPLSRAFLLEFTWVVIGLTIVDRIIIKQFNGAKRSEESGRNILVIGHSAKGSKYIEEIKKHKYLNFNIIGDVCIKIEDCYDGLSTLGGMSTLF